MTFDVMMHPKYLAKLRSDTYMVERDGLSVQGAAHCNLSCQFVDAEHTFRVLIRSFSRQPKNVVLLHVR